MLGENSPSVRPAEVEEKRDLRDLEKRAREKGERKRERERERERERKRSNVRAFERSFSQELRAVGG